MFITNSSWLILSFVNTLDVIFSILPSLFLANKLTLLYFSFFSVFASWLLKVNVVPLIAQKTESRLVLVIPNGASITVLQLHILQKAGKNIKKLDLNPIDLIQKYPHAMKL